MKYLLIFTLLVHSICSAETKTVPDTRLISPKIINFELNSIPESYFSSDLNQAKSLIEQNQYENALEIIDKEIKSTTKRSPLQKAYILQGIINHREGKFKEAITSYNNYFKLNAANSDVLLLKALSELKDGLATQAENTLNESIWFNKYSFLTASEANLQLSYLYIALDNKTKAEEFLNKALAVKSDNIAVLNQKAELLLQQDKKAEAISTLRSALTVQAENTQSKLLLSQALLTDVNRSNDEKQILEAGSLARDVLDKSEGNQNTQQTAIALLIRSKIENSKLDEAKKLTKEFSKKYPVFSELQDLKKQIQIEEEGAKESEDGKSE